MGTRKAEQFIKEVMTMPGSLYADAVCPKCKSVGGIENYDPLAGAWMCPTCRETVIWVNGEVGIHFGVMRKKLGWGRFWRVDTSIKEREEKSKKTDRL